MRLSVKCVFRVHKIYEAAAYAEFFKHRRNFLSSYRWDNAILANAFQYTTGPRRND
jgi:hypothetical protein